MSESSRTPIHHDDGIVVIATLELLRKAAAKVLFEFTEIVETAMGNVSSEVKEVCIGDSVVFREKMDLMPAEIVAVKIGDEHWLVISTTEVPKSGWPTTKDAMRVAASEAKKLKRVKEFLAKEIGNYIIQHVEDWNPDKMADADKIRKIVKNAAKRWGH